VDRITTARKADAAENSDRAKAIAKAGNFVLQNSGTSRKCKLEPQYKKE